LPPDREALGGGIYFGSDNEDNARYFLHRHPFHSSFYLCSFFLQRSGDIETVTKDEIFRVSSNSDAPDAAKVKQTRSRLTKPLEKELAPVVDATKRASKMSAVADAFSNRIDNDKAAIDMLETFIGDLSRKAFVDRLLKGTK
jgi:hypothetical protein